MNENILRVPYSDVNEDWDLLQKFLAVRGNPKYIIIGNVDLRRRKDISDFGNLISVEGDLNLLDCQNIKTLGKLKKIEGTLILTWSSIESLGDLEEVGRILTLHHCHNIKTLGKLKKVGGYLILDLSSIESLGGLQFVGGNLYIQHTNIPPSELNNINVAGDIIK
jgi:hypothetical protein